MLPPDDLLQFGGALRVAAIASYSAALASYASALVASKLKSVVEKLSTRLAAVGITVHTAYLASRWMAAGRVEILSRGRAAEALSSSDRFWLTLSHPPYTNLFDALNFTAWALVVCYLVVERRWGLRVVGVLAMALALVAMGEAALVSDQSIEPLVPALQSYWILIHVGMLFISYALFTIGSVASLLYLVRAGTSTPVLGAVQALAGALFLALGGGGKLLSSAVFEMSPSWVHQIPSRLHPGRMLDVTSAVHSFAPGATKATKLLLPVAGVGPFLLVAILLMTAGAITYLVQAKADRGVRARGYQLIAAAFGALTIGIGVLVYRIVAGGELPLPITTRFAQGVHGPYGFALGSNYALGLLALIWGTTLGFLVTVPLRERIAALLPDPQLLEDITYRMVIVGWPLLTVGVVMGGMWANEAWGRFWGWDPKETWALITWVVYAGYLHARLTMGWTGKRTATIAVAAFAVVVFTFLGVNLGLTGDGLHSYGAG